jgi:hypothetical protein
MTVALKLMLTCIPRMLGLVFEVQSFEKIRIKRHAFGQVGVEYDQIA